MSTFILQNAIASTPSSTAPGDSLRHLKRSDFRALLVKRIRPWSRDAASSPVASVLARPKGKACTGAHGVLRSNRVAAPCHQTFALQETPSVFSVQAGEVQLSNPKVLAIDGERLSHGAFDVQALDLRPIMQRRGGPGLRKSLICREPTSESQRCEDERARERERERKRARRGSYTCRDRSHNGFQAALFQFFFNSDTKKLMAMRLFCLQQR